MYKGQGILEKLGEDVLHKSPLKRLDFGDWDNKIVIIPRDPKTIFAYWNISKREAKKLKDKRNVEMILEVMRGDTIKQRILRTFNAQNEYTMKHYIKGLESDKEYCVKVNIPEIKLEIYSNKVSTPKNFFSEFSKEYPSLLKNTEDPIRAF